MPDVIADYRIADKFASQVEKNFDLLDSNKDGKLTAEEMALAGPENCKRLPSQCLSAPRSRAHRSLRSQGNASAQA